MAAASQVTGVVKADISDLKSKYAQAKEETSSLGDHFKKVFGDMAKTAGGFLMASVIQDGITRLVDGFKDLIKTGIDYNTEMERLHAQLLAITHSGGATDKILAWIQKFGQAVPDTTEHLAQATVHLQAFGFDAMQVMPYLANVAAAMGKDLPTAAQAFTDAYEGRFMMMANELGISKEALVQFGMVMSKNGHVLQSSFLPAFEKLVAAKFPTGTTDAMKTMAGQMTNLTDRWQQFAGLLTKPLFDVAKMGLSAFFSFMDQHKDQINGLATLIGTTLANGLKAVGDFFHYVADKFAEAFNDKNGQKVKDLKQLAHDLLGKLQDLGGWLKDHLKPALDDVVTAAGHFTTWISNSKQHLDEFKQWWSDWGGLIKGVASIILVYFLPAMIAAGLTSIKQGAIIAANWIGSIAKSGTASLISAGQMWTNSFSFVSAMVATAATATKQAVIVASTWVAQMIATGVKAAASALVMTGQFVGAMVTTALAAAKNAIIVAATWVAQLIASGAKAAWAALIITGQFIVAMASAAAAAIKNAVGLGVFTTAETGVGTAADTAAGSAVVGGGGILGLAAAAAYLLISNSNTISSWINSWDGLANATTGDCEKILDNLRKLAAGINNVNSEITAGIGLWNRFAGAALAGARAAQNALAAAAGHGSQPAPPHHAAGGVVGPNEMLSLINDQGGFGELVKLTTGDIVFPHNQSVTLLQQAQAQQPGRGDTYNFVGITDNAALERRMRQINQRKAALYLRH